MAESYDLSIPVATIFLKKAQHLTMDSEADVGLFNSRCIIFDM